MLQATAKKDLFQNYSTTKVLVRKDTEVVYEGRDQKLQRPVVIRIAELPKNPFQVLQNLTALKTASHPSLPRVLDFGIEDGCFYLVVEAVAGKDLRAFDRSLASAPNSPRRIRALAQVFLQIAWALDALHENGLTAGAIVPEKIVVNDAGRGRLLVSDVLQEPSGAREFSPVSTDIRELGRLMYKTLCGIEYDPTNSLPSALQNGLTPRFDAVLTKAASDHPDHAYMTARELALELSHAVASL
jgi:serine/threonine protein kinase